MGEECMRILRRDLGAFMGLEEQGDHEKKKKNYGILIIAVGRRSDATESGSGE